MSHKHPIKHNCIYNQSESFTTIDGKSAIVPVDGKIYWHIVNFTKDQEKYKTIFAIEQAFKEWQPYFYPIIFESTDELYKAHIKIHFTTNDQNPPVQFRDEVLAYAFAPYGGSLQGNVYFNDEYNWANMHTKTHHDLFKVAVHEIGHTFNIGHSKVPEDIMAPIYDPFNDVLITKDSINAVRYLYKKYFSELSTVVTVVYDELKELKEIFSKKFFKILVNWKKIRNIVNNL